jgi:hypothetical protein
MRLTLVRAANECRQFRVEIGIGDEVAKSAPQDVKDVFQDVLANLEFIENKSLRTVFFCNQPIANINYVDDMVEIFFYRPLLKGGSRVSDKIAFVDFKAQFSEIIDTLRVFLSDLSENLSALEEEVVRDREEGIYAVYLGK